MNRKKRLKIASLILLGMMIMQYSFVIAVSKTNSFFEVNKQEVSQGETLEMTLDISKVEFEKFDFRLGTNLKVSDFYTNEQVVINNDNNVVNVSIDKTKIKLDKITLYYQIPKDTKTGTKIELLAQILVEAQTVENNENNINENIIDNSLTNQTINNRVETRIVEEKNIEVLVVEKSEDIGNNPEREMPGGELPGVEIPEKQNENLSDEMNSNNTNTFPSLTQTSNYSQTSIKLSSISSQPEENTAVYNGSSNNYLSKIEIDGLELNTVFNKENGNYFLEVEGKTSLNITVTKESDDSKVYITGEDNLKVGDNKILISVTAENSSIRYYRIFVTNK